MFRKGFIEYACKNKHIKYHIFHLQEKTPQTNAAFNCLRTVGLFYSQTLLSALNVTLRKLSLKTHFTEVICYHQMLENNRQIKVSERYQRKFNLLVSLFIGKSHGVVMLLVIKLELWFEHSADLGLWCCCQSYCHPRAQRNQGSEEWNLHQLEIQ